MLIRLGPQCSVKAGRARHSVRADLGGHNGAHGVTRPTCFGSPRPPSLTQYLGPQTPACLATYGTKNLGA